MGTETNRNIINVCVHECDKVKLNNPLMGTETTKRPVILLAVNYTAFKK